MNTPKVLNTVLNVMIFLIVFSIFAGIIMTILTLTGVSYDFIDSETLKVHSKNTPSVYIFMVLTLLVYFIFVFGIFRLKKASNLFLTNDFYNPELIKNINISGKSMILSGVFWWLLGGLGSIHFKKSISLEVSEKTFIYLFIIVIGLFMMLMSKVFENAIALKEENDLTI